MRTLYQLNSCSVGFENYDNDFEDYSVICRSGSLDGLLINIGCCIKRDGFDFAANTILSVPQWQDLDWELKGKNIFLNGGITGYGYPVKELDVEFPQTDITFYRSGLVEVESFPFGTTFTINLFIDLSDKRNLLDVYVPLSFISPAAKVEGFLFGEDDIAKELSRARKRKPVCDKAMSDISRLNLAGLVQSRIDALPVIAASPTSFAEAIEAGVPIADLLA